MKKTECSICGVEEDDQFTHGYFGSIPVSFCVWCISSIMDMAKQMSNCDCDEE
jgi:hypothetical protein